MKSQTELKLMDKRIQLLSAQRTLAWTEWHSLNDKEGKTKDEIKHQSNTMKLIDKLNYQIGGLRRDFNDLKSVVILEILNTK